MFNALPIAVVLALLAQDAQNTVPKPDLSGAPVYVIGGNVVVFPKGVEQPPAEYKSVLGKKPLALIKLDGKVVGEVYLAPLPGSPKEEAKDMAASPKNSDKIELKKQGSEKIGKEDAEFVTLKMNVKGNFGDTSIVHSVYLPRGTSCVTFKLVSSEEQFDSLLPYLKAMLDPQPQK
jgi:hypothetical protein